MKFIELFAGVGGFRYGLEQVSGNNARDCADDKGGTSQYSGCSFRCVWANEWDKYASGIYRYHWNDGTMHEGDIRAVDPHGLPEHDLIVGGFPCQAFSIAGKRGGFSDVRGTMFFEICRIAKACGTKYLLLENVKGLLNHKGGATFQTIISTLDELGYDCQWQVLNSKNYLPQNRERVFIIGHLRGQPRPQVFPIGEGAKNVEQELGGPKYCAFSLQSRDYKGVQGRQGNTLIHTAYQGETREYADCSPTISTPSGGGHLPMVARTPLKFMERNQKNIEGDYSFTIDSVNTGGVKVGSSIRRLTPTECERLQTFPDGWTKYGLFNGEVKEISDTQRYKTMGNAVTTKVITHIGTELLNSLEWR